MELSAARCKAQNVHGMMFMSCTTYNFRRALCVRFRTFLMRYLVSPPISILPQCTCVCASSNMPRLGPCRARTSLTANTQLPTRSRKFRAPRIHSRCAYYIRVRSIPSAIFNGNGRARGHTVDAGSECSWRTHVPAHVGSRGVLITRGVSFVTHNAANPLCELHQCHGSTKHDTSRIVYGEDG